MNHEYEFCLPMAGWLDEWVGSGEFFVSFYIRFSIGERFPGLDYVSKEDEGEEGEEKEE